MYKALCVLPFICFFAHAERLEEASLSELLPTTLDMCATSSRSTWQCRQSLLQGAGGLHMLRQSHLTEELSGIMSKPTQGQVPHSSLETVHSIVKANISSNMTSFERTNSLEIVHGIVKVNISSNMTSSERTNRSHQERNHVVSEALLHAFNGTDPKRGVRLAAPRDVLMSNTTKSSANTWQDTASPLTIMLVLLIASILFCIIALGSRIYRLPKENESLANFAARQTAGRLSNEARIQRQVSAASSPATFAPIRPHSHSAAAAYPLLGSATVLSNAGSKPELTISTPARGSSTVSTPTMPKVPAIKLHALRNLCPSLVVPDSTECILAVPTLCTAGMPRQRSATFDILDLSGKPVIRAEVNAPSLVKGPVLTTIDATPIVLLRAASAQAMPRPLAYCRIDREPQGRQSVFFYNAQDELFAHLAKDPFRNCYVVIGGPSGVQMTLEGNFHEHAVTAKNEHRQIQADTELAGEYLDSEDFALQGGYYQVRVLSNVDVGLMLCSLICIDHMETDWGMSGDSDS